MAEIESLRERAQEAADQARTMFALLLGVVAFVVLAAYDQRQADSVLDREIKLAEIELRQADALRNEQQKQVDRATAAHDAARKKREHAEWEWRDKNGAGSQEQTDADMRLFHELLSTQRKAKDALHTAKLAAKAAAGRLTKAEADKALARTAFVEEKALDPKVHEKLRIESNAAKVRASELKRQSDHAAASEAQATLELTKVEEQIENRGAATLIALHRTINDAKADESRTLELKNAEEDAIQGPTAVVDRWTTELGQLKVERDSQASASVKLPIVDVELQRPLFERVSPALVLILYVYFTYHLLQVRRRLDACDGHADAPPTDEQRALSLAPSPLLSERYAHVLERIAIGSIVFASGPLGLWALWASTKDAQDGAVKAMPTANVRVEAIDTAEQAFAIASIGTLWMAISAARFYRRVSMERAAPAQKWWFGSGLAEKAQDAAAPASEAKQ